LIAFISKSSVVPAEQRLNGCVLSTTAIAAWQDWVSAVKVDKRADGNGEAYEPGGI
jgi:hypothetical protein